MKFNKEYTAEILKENFINYADVTQTSFEYWLETEFENCPESFDVFFDSSWDELTTSEREERKELILSIFE